MRYLAAGVCCRILNDDYKECIRNLLGYIENMICECNTVDMPGYDDEEEDGCDQRKHKMHEYDIYTVDVMGYEMKLCHICFNGVICMHKRHSIFGPYTFILYGDFEQRHIKLYFPIGTVMRKDEHGRWIDSAQRIEHE